MIVLALETATRAGSLALLRDDRIHELAGNPRRTHGERLPGDVLNLLRAEGLHVRDVDVLAVVSGPGSFTGLRVGIAAIQGLALAAGKKVVEMPTLDAMAIGWLETARMADSETVVACLDGQRRQVFYAAWDAGRAGGQPALEAARIEPSVGSPEDLAAQLAGTDRRIVLVTDVVDRLAPLVGPDVTLTGIAGPLAGVAARFAARHADAAVAPHALRPVYLRRPDAELARERSRAAAQVAPDPEASEAIDTLVFERAVASDLAAVAALQQRTFSNPWGADSMKWELEHTDVARLYVARTRDGEVIAYCACWMVFDELHINSLAVDDRWRRQGLARRLLRRVFADAVREGAHSATLEVRRSNDAAHALYAGLGFTTEGVRRDYYQNPREDALILWHRRLVGAPGLPAGP